MEETMFSRILAYGKRKDFSCPSPQIRDPETLMGMISKLRGEFLRVAIESRSSNGELVWWCDHYVDKLSALTSRVQVRVDEARRYRRKITPRSLLRPAEAGYLLKLSVIVLGKDNPMASKLTGGQLGLGI